jgi:isopenicillin N synthase-like dioxygenase
MISVPVIDAIALFDACNGNHNEAISQLNHALRSTGFLILRNSAVKPAVAINNLFQSPQEVKDAVDMKNTKSNRGWGCAGAERVNSTLNPDYKEFFDSGVELPEDSPMRNVRYHDPNLWPAIPDFKEQLVRYYETAHSTCMKLLVAIAQCLGYPADYFVSAFTTPMSLLRGNFYPPRPPTATEKDFGIAPHTDYGFLTLVSSDGVPGLEIMDAEGNWVDINPMEPWRDCVVNFGEMLEIWSDGRAKATLHRVVGHSGMKRTSCAFFFNPNFETVLSSGSAAEPVIAGEYLTKRYNETYVHIAAADGNTGRDMGKAIAPSV